MTKKILPLIILSMLTMSCAKTENAGYTGQKSESLFEAQAAAISSAETETPKSEPVQQAVEFFFDVQTALYGLQDIEGNVLISPKWIETADEFREGLAWVKEPMPDENTHRTGYIDSTGNYAIEPWNYEFASSFSEGLAFVSLPRTSWPGRRIYIDREGNVVLGEDHLIVNAGMFKNGYAICDIELHNAQLPFMSNIIDKQGRIMLNEYYDSIFYSEADNLYFALNNNGMRTDNKLVFISENFNILAEFEGYDWVVTDFHDGVPAQVFNEQGAAVISRNYPDRTHSVIDKSFNILVSGQMVALDKHYIRMFDQSLVYGDDGYYWIDINQKMVFFDYNGEMKKDYLFDHAETSDGSFYAFMMNNKWGYLDSGLHVMVEPVYEFASTQGEGPYVVMKDGKFGYVDNKLKEFISPQYDYAGEFINGIAPVIQDGRFFFINQAGIKIDVNYKDKLEYLELTEDAIQMLPYLFHENIEEKILKFLSPLFSKFKPSSFENYSEIPPGAFMYHSIRYNILPETNPKHGFSLDFDLNLSDAMRSAVILFGDEMAAYMKPGSEFLIVYDENTQKFRPMETATYDITEIVILDISEQNNIYEATISTSLVSEFDVISLYPLPSDNNGMQTGIRDADIELTKEVLYFDMQDETVQAYQLYSSRYQDYFSRNYDMILRRGADYIRANPEMFEKYKITLELSEGMFKIRSLRKIS